ncbi:MAG: hypothetical protein PQJ44_08615, partial [Sphaerochaetaceae bacterium]|nr:hypothetical protein [Sphaerochaetaceae bacterium]
MLVLLGILGILACIASVIFKLSGARVKELRWITYKFSGIVGIVGISLIFTSSGFFFAERGFNYLLVSPTGKMSAVMSQGIKIIIPGTKIDKWQKYIDVKVIGAGGASEDDLD